MGWQDSQAKLKKWGIGQDVEPVKTMTSSVTTAWGVDWDEESIARDLMQNFFDANRDQIDRVKVEATGDVVVVTAPAEFNLLRLLYLGSEKGADDVGQYGEGFKVAIMRLLRDHGVGLVMVSGRDVLRFRVSETPVSGTQMYPIMYDFFESRKPAVGSRLMLRGCSPKLAAAMKGGIYNFFHPANPLIGKRLWQSGDFELYRSTSPNGHIFYEKLRRGSIPDIPVVLVIHKEYTAMEKKIGSDRDRNAFGEPLRKTAYNLFARYGTSRSARAQQAIVREAKACWERGHPLLAEVARHRRYGCSWSQNDIRNVFGDRYYARCTSGQAGIQVRYDEIEEPWRAAGRKPLPNYFKELGLTAPAFPRCPAYPAGDAGVRILGEYRGGKKRIRRTTLQFSQIRITPERAGAEMNGSPAGQDSGDLEIPTVPCDGHGKQP